MLITNNTPSLGTDNEEVLNLKPDQYAIWDEINVCAAEIEEILWQKPFMINRSWKSSYYVQLTAYLLYKALSSNENSLDSILDKEDFGLSSLVEKINLEDSWNELWALTDRHDAFIFRGVALLRIMDDMSDSTPLCIADIAEEILNLQEDDRFADLCCGQGWVLHDFVSRHPGIKATGYDINPEAITIARMEAELYSQDISLDIKNVLELKTPGEDDQFDKVFCNYPFGMQIKNIRTGKKDYLDEIVAKAPSVSRATSSDWIFNMKIVETLSTTGKGVSIMTNGSTWNMIDAPIRKYFVENGLIESVISLPVKLFANTSIGTSMVVFSHGNNGVRLVDATEQYVPGRRTNDLSEDNVKFILNALQEDSDYSLFVSKEQLRDNDYVLSISRYTNSNQKFRNGVPFDTVIKRITRGAPLKAEELDKLSSNSPTDYQFLMLSNIQNGLVQSDLPYITRIDKRNEKYCLSNHCLILSKNGYPYKVAVMEMRENQKIMANGNLYIIELDTEKVDPYFIAAFLSSETGVSSLKAITVGATIPNLGVDQLKNMLIPLPSLKVQKEIGARYVEARDQLALLNLKIEKAKAKMSQAYDPKEVDIDA